MELPWVLLALAGTGMAAGLGDSLGGMGVGGAARCLPRGSLEGVCAREGVMWLGTAWGGPHSSIVPLALAPLAP